MHLFAVAAVVVLLWLIKGAWTDGQMAWQTTVMMMAVAVAILFATNPLDTLRQLDRPIT
jgi:hypothetical protein